MRRSIPIFLIVLIAGCAGNIALQKKAPSIPSEQNKEGELYFCPKDNCSYALESNILSAKNTVHCAFFDIDLENVIAALSRKSHEIDVKLVVDSDNYGEVTGDGVRADDRNQLMHNKFCIIDNEIVLTGSFNPTNRDAYKNNNNFHVLHSKELAKNYNDEFDELWDKKFGKRSNKTTISPVIMLNGVIIENYFCPEDNCRGEVVAELKAANSSIFFMTFSFTEEEIADALLFHDNISIKGVMEKMQAGSSYSQYKRLKEFGIDVIIDKNPYNMHHKVFIIDNKTVITGSYNPTGAGSFRNDENILIFHDERIAQKYYREFIELAKT